MNSKSKIYESNDETTTGPVCRRVGQDAEQLVPVVSGRAVDLGPQAPHEGAAAEHRGLPRRQALHRRRTVALTKNQNKQNPFGLVETTSLML